MRGITPAVITAVLAIAAPAAAAAGDGLEPGVHVDPGSPAGKEYQFPIPATRSETSGRQGSSGTGRSQNPPLFGVGITPPSGPPSAAGSGSGSSSRSLSARRSRRSDAVSAARRGSVGDTRAHEGSAPASASFAGSPASGGVGGSGWIPLVVGGALVLILGGGGGLVLKRRFLGT